MISRVMMSEESSSTIAYPAHRTTTAPNDTPNPKGIPHGLVRMLLSFWTLS